jgi:hypothetical protein
MDMGRVEKTVSGLIGNQPMNLLRRIQGGLTLKKRKPFYIYFSVINNKLLPRGNIPEGQFICLVDIPKRHGALVKLRVILGVIFPPHSLSLRSCRLM